ncbi:MAG TPA: cellulose synthase family protein [Chthoniobacteraceae bacterium]|jgi:cellulose synthase/poly-beta-1,6-N-acetylglucosamine synthase-like glycosyltransferase|nr:cellulose synthase family protein [Chthoniobacteraceae bacterium]
MDGRVGHFIWAICYLAVLFGLCLYGAHRYVIVYLFYKHRKNVPKPVRQFDALPKVTVQLPIFNELYVVERLLDAVSKLDYPRDLLQIQVLDDSTDETQEICEAKMKELRAQGFDIEHKHRLDRSGFKAGALAAGLDTCKGDYILILDADFVPTPNLLQETIHFFTDPGIGMIQSRWGHLNRTFSLLTRVQAMFLDGHLVLEQTARSRSGRFFNFNGTAGLWRRSCIENSGGWQHDTLTEDLDLSYRAQIKGWRFIYLADLVTPAELPAEINGFKSQQHRWTKGSIQTCKKLLPVIWRNKELPILIKLEATAHLTSNFAYLLLFFLCVLLHPISGGLGAGVWRTVLLDIPVFVAASLSACVFYVCAQRILYPRTWMKEILLLPLLLGLGIGLAINNARAVLEAMFNHASEFTRTPKYGIVKKNQPLRASRYKALKTVLPVIELGFAAYFTVVLLEAMLRNQWGSVPFLLLFQGGFSYVGLASIAQYRPRATQESDVEDEPEDALPA